jgi:hypothetical protein
VAVRLTVISNGPVPARPWCLTCEKLLRLSPMFHRRAFFFTGVRGGLGPGSVRRTLALPIRQGIAGLLGKDELAAASPALKTIFHAFDDRVKPVALGLGIGYRQHVHDLSAAGENGFLVVDLVAPMTAEYKP